MTQSFESSLVEYASQAWEKAIEEFLIERYGDLALGIINCLDSARFVIDHNGVKTFYWDDKPVLACDGFPDFKVRRV